MCKKHILEDSIASLVTVTDSALPTKTKVEGSTFTETSLTEPMVRFPVKCPVCTAEILTQFPVALIAEAFLTNESIRLYANCHQQFWIASEIERAQIREYLGAAWFEPP